MWLFCKTFVNCQTQGVTWAILLLYFYLNAHSQRFQVYNLFLSIFFDLVHVNNQLAQTYLTENLFFNCTLKKQKNLRSELYQSKWVKINSSWVIFIFRFMCAAANASELLCMAHLVNNERFLYHSNLPF